MIRLVILEREKYLYHHVHRFLALSHFQTHSGFCSQVISFNWIVSSLISSKEEMRWFTLTHCRIIISSLWKRWQVLKNVLRVLKVGVWVKDKTCKEQMQHYLFRTSMVHGFETWFFTITFFVPRRQKFPIIWLVALYSGWWLSHTSLNFFLFCFEMC